MGYISPLRAWQGNILPYWLMSRPEVSPSAKILYSRLCGYCGEREHCWPSKETLSRELGLTPRQIRRLINELEGLGLIEVRRNGLSFVYYMLDHPWMHDASAQKDPTFVPTRSRRQRRRDVCPEQLGFPSMSEATSAQKAAVCVAPASAVPSDSVAPPPDVVAGGGDTRSDVIVPTSDVSVRSEGKPASEPLYLGRGSSKRTKEEKKIAAPAPLVAASPAPVLVLVPTSGGESKPGRKADPIREQVQQVWKAYLDLHSQHTRPGVKPVLTSKRSSHIAQRIREYGLQAVLQAVALLWQDDWRRERGYTAIDYAVRSSEQLEKILSSAGSVASGNRREGSTWVQGADDSQECTQSRNGWTLGEDGRFYDYQGQVVQDFMTEEEIRRSVPAAAVPLYLEQLARQKAAAGARA